MRERILKETVQRGYLKVTRQAEALSEAGWDGEGNKPKISHKVDAQADQIKQLAGSLKMAVRHNDDLQVLSDLSMITKVAALAMKEIGWSAEAQALTKVGNKLRKAAAEQLYGPES